MPRAHKRPDGFPTRNDRSYFTPAETAITAACYAVESVGASVALTNAVTLLLKARDLVADHVEFDAFTENDCPGHVASDDDPKVCRFCGCHVDDLRPPEEGAP